ncbi:hypothetical protein BH23GEM9_BH23GEM9_18380 [soil metagenome]
MIFDARGMTTIAGWRRGARERTSRIAPAVLSVLVGMVLVSAPPVFAQHAGRPVVPEGAAVLARRGAPTADIVAPTFAPADIGVASSSGGAAAALAQQSAVAADRQVSPWRPLRVAKWSLTVASAGTALYGFANNRNADDAYAGLERLCGEDPDRCKDRLPGGGYADPLLEAEYQHIRSLDGRARTALIVSQVGVATSVVLFILDLRNRQPPPNIPYEPTRFEVGPASDGGLTLRVNLPSR